MVAPRLGEMLDCPECGAACNRDEVDVGVGIICGPWGCSMCGWSEEDAWPMKDIDWDNKFNEEDSIL